METKTHYRKVFKSDHLGIADLEDMQEEGTRLVFTIKEVRQEINVQVAGHRGDFNIAYFKEKIKPLVLNATNSKVVKSFNKNSPFVEDWKDTIIELYIDQNVQMKGQIVGGVRIKKIQPRTEKPELVPDTKNWDYALNALKLKKTTIEGVEKKFKVSNENHVKLMRDAGI